MTTNYVLNNKHRRLAVRILLVAILACYLLPWYSIQLPGDTGVSMSGYNLLVGEKWNSIKIEGRNLTDNEVEMMKSAMELAGVKRNLMLYPSFWGILAFILVAISIVFTFKSTRSGPVMAAVFTFVGLLIMLIGYANTALKLDEAARAMQWVGVGAVNGARTTFMIMLYIYGLTILAAILASIGKYKPNQSLDSKAGTSASQ